MFQLRLIQAEGLTMLMKNTTTSGYRYIAHHKDDAQKLITEMFSNMTVGEDGITIFKLEYVTVTYTPDAGEYPYELLSREGKRTRCPSFETVVSTIMKKWW